MSSYRSMPRRYLAFAITVALALTPTLAMADSCDDLRQSDADNDRESKALVDANKGPAVVFLSCLLIGTDNYRQTHDAGQATATFAVCAGLGCALTDSYSNCLSVNLELFGHAIRATISRRGSNEYPPA